MFECYQRISFDHALIARLYMTIEYHQWTSVKWTNRENWYRGISVKEVSNNQ